jgi:uncharacterized protein (TIGR03435 family)
MRCEELRNQFADYLTDRLEASATAEVLQHLSSCPACKSEADELEVLWAEMGAVPDTPADVKTMSRRFGKVLDTVQGVRTTAPRPHRKLVYAAALIAAVTIGGIAAQRSGLFTKPSPHVEPSVKPALAPEAPTVASTVRESKEPEPATTPTSREALRAAQVAAAQNTDAGAGQLQFDATSIRPFSLRANPPRIGTPTPGAVRCRGVDGVVFGRPGSGPSGPNTPPVPLGRCTGLDAMATILVAAYADDGDTYVRIENLPSGFNPNESLDNPMYQIEAVAPTPSQVTKAELKRMLQAMLSDRFKLKLRQETREVDGFVLTVAKNGPKFKASTSEEEPCCPPVRPKPISPNPGVLDSFAIKGALSMKAFVRWIGSTTGITVEDKTKLVGIFDIALQLNEIRPTATRGQGGTGGPRGPQYDPTPAKALEEQLGLHLEPGKVPVTFLIIEHIERPSEN